jgi:TM2 domain-containing membrane protein YozV
MAKSRSTAIVLSILLSGLGQIYLGEAFRGVIILAAAIVIAVVSSFALTFYFAIIPIIS